MSALTTTYLHIGSNLGDRSAQLARARQLISEQIGPIQKASGIYETEAWGNTDQPDFFNQALMVRTSLKPQALMASILKIEQEMGRERTQKWEARQIDIDILFYAKKVIDDADLKIPHPHMQERNFVLIPLMEIAGNLLHPILHQTVEELYAQSGDTLEVILLDDHAVPL